MLKNIGKYTYGTENLSIQYHEGSHLSIGAFCSLGKNITVILGSNHRTDWISTYPFGHIHEERFPAFSGAGHPTSRGDVIIGSDVWIAQGVTILSGVRIGSGAVIAANSHVVKDVPEYSIVGGNPAKVIRMRFSDSQIADLLKIAWWEFPDEKINELSPLLCSPDIHAFLEKGLEVREFSNQ